MDKDVTVDSADQAAVDKVKEIFDKEPGAIRTSYKNASNIKQNWKPAIMQLSIKQIR